MNANVTTQSTYAVGILLPLLDACAVLGRFMSRRHKRARLEWDDWMTLPALILTTGCGCIMIVGAAIGTFGSHSVPTDSMSEALSRNPPRQELSSKLIFAFYFLSTLSLGAIRLVFLGLFDRIFRGVIFKRINAGLMVYVVVWVITFAVGSTAGCGSHPENFWSSWQDLKNQCFDVPGFLLAMTITDFLIDFCILVLPFCFFWQLKMKVAYKIGISIVFLSGGFSVAVSAGRVYLYAKMYHFKYGSDERLFGVKGTFDDIGVLSTIAWWSMLELGIALIASNLPVLPGLLPEGAIARASERLFDIVLRVSSFLRKPFHRSEWQSTHSVSQSQTSNENICRRSSIIRTELMDDQEIKAWV